MKPTPKSPEPAPLLAFGAHPDDIEFGCGGIVARETRAGRPAHFVICSRGESGTHGTPAQRAAEAERAARLLGATVEFVSLGRDAELEVRPEHAYVLAAVIRRVRPAFVLAPTLVEDQHPDHPKVGRIARDAARLARYGRAARLSERPAHAIEHLLFYAVSPTAEPEGAPPVLIDVSAKPVVAAWTAAMRAHASQVRRRPYVKLQLARARVHGLGAGVGYAQPLFPADPLVFGSLSQLFRSARRF
ncbi:MAG TPA: PIG-L family deacetylase [Opitutaceae bacterium]|nr:PIG-L family deacetylase [Opitutaceae bacterium]